MQSKMMMFCVIAIICVGASDPKQARDAALRAAERAGGTLGSERDLEVKPVLALHFMHKPLESSVLRTLRDVGDLRVLKMQGMQINAEHMEALLSLTHVRRLVLTCSTFSRDAVKLIPKLRHLQELDLSITAVDDEALAGLESDQLRVLNLAYTKISDATLKRLKGTPMLWELTLMRDGITDVGLKALPDLKELRFISLYETKITDVGLAELGRFPNLGRVMLGKTQISHAGLRHLQSVKSLWCLDLDDTVITQAEAKELGRLSTLKYLSLMGTKIDDAGIRHLKPSPGVSGRGC